MAEICDTCINEEVCSLWRQVEDQDASYFQLDGCCKYFREAAARWIPVTERLPEDDEHVLCCTVTKTGRKNVVIGYWMDGMWRCGMNSNVIAWMPLPEPPGEEEDGE